MNTTKLFVVLRGSGEVRKLDSLNVLSNGTIFCYAESPISMEIGVDCDLCDEQGRLLKPQEEKPYVVFVCENDGLVQDSNPVSLEQAREYARRLKSLYSHIYQYVETIAKEEAPK